MSLRLALYFLIPVVFYIMFCIEYIPDWQLAHLCTVAYVYGYSCCIEYRVFGGQTLFVSLLLLVCSIAGGCLYCAHAEYNDLYSTSITDAFQLLSLLASFLLNYAFAFKVLVPTFKMLKTLDSLSTLFGSLITTTSTALRKGYYGPQVNYDNKVPIRIDDAYINNLAESILEGRYNQLDRVVHVLSIYSKTCSQTILKCYQVYLAKIVTRVFGDIYIIFFQFIWVVFLLYMSNNTSYFIVFGLVSQVIMFNSIDIQLGLYTFKHIMFKTSALVIVKTVYVYYHSGPLNDSYLLIILECWRSFGNLFLMPYFCNGRKSSSNLRWLQLTILCAGMVYFPLPEQYDSMIFRFVIPVFYCSIVLQVVEFKLFARDDLTYKFILLTINIVLSTIIDIKVQKRGIYGMVSHAADIVCFSSLCMCFNNLVSKVFFSLSGEYTFTVLNLRDLYKISFMRAVLFFIMQLVHIGGYCIFFTVIIWITNNTYTGIFEKDTKEIKWNVRVGLLHLGLPAADKLIMLTLLLFGLILVIISMYIILRFHLYYRSMIIHFVCGDNERDLLNTNVFGFNKSHDIFLSYSEECEVASPFVLNKMCPYLTKDTGLSVTSSEDIVPGQMFHTKLSEKMASCRKVVIIWTKAYEMDENAYRAQFEMLLTPLIKARVFQEHDIYIIRLENTQVSLQASLLGEIVEWNFDISSEKAKLRKVGEKIRQSIAEDNCLVNRIQRWFANMIGRMGH